MTKRCILLALPILVAAGPVSAQIKKPGLSYKALLRDGGKVVGMRANSIMIQKGHVLYSCQLQTARKSRIRWCKALKAEGERDR
jgi:hypothetical protein